MEIPTWPTFRPIRAFTTPSLVATTGPECGARYLVEDVCTIGRSGQSNIRISDNRVSRQHARIRREDDRYILEDLQGRDTTFVNDRAVTWHALKHNDEIRIADALFRFEDPPADEVEDATAIAVHDAFGESEHDEGGEPIRDRVDAEDNPLTQFRQLAGQTQLAEAHERLVTVYEIANAIGTQLDQNELIDEILRALLRVFRQASRAVMMLLDKSSGQLVARAEQTSGPAAHLRKAAISKTVMKEVVDYKRAVICGGMASDAFRGPVGASVAGMLSYSQLCAPLVARGEVLGVIHLTSNNLITPFVRADLDLLVGISTQAAIALQNAEMHTELLARERLKHDMEVAHEVQRRFLPLLPPKIPGWTFGAEYRPAQAIGGDFYDFIRLGPTRLGVLIGDVTGKGISAALLMARVTSEFRMLAMVEKDPVGVMARVNASLVAAGYEGIFVTACYAVVDLTACTITYCNAGHLPPLVRRHGTSPDRLQRLVRADLALGVLDETSFEQETHTLGHGDLVFLMSDGVVESTDANNQQLGFEPIEASMRASHGDAEATLEDVMSLVRGFVGDARQYDDLTMVCFGIDLARMGQHTLPPPPQPRRRG